MFNRILIATDGSPLSRTTIASGVELARLLGASIVGIHVRSPQALMPYGYGSNIIPSHTESAYREQMGAAAKMFLAEIEVAARKAGVRFEGVDVEDSSPADAILRTAQAQNCDLIVMASHGRRGLSGTLLGSETSKVLTHARQAVLVTR